MPHLVDHAARLGRVRKLHGVIDPPQSHAGHRLRLRPVEPDRASDERDLHALASRRLCTLLGHRYAPTSSASSLPRNRATCAGSFRSISPAKVARTTLCGLADPSDLVSTF